MKKIYIVLFAFIVNLVLFNLSVKAETSTNTFPNGLSSSSFNEDNLYGKCVYKGQTESVGSYLDIKGFQETKQDVTITIYVDENSNIYYESNIAIIGSFTSAEQRNSINLNSELTFGDFFDDEKKIFDCSTLEYIYVGHLHGSNPNKYAVSHTFDIVRELKNYYDAFMLDKEKSKSYAKKVDDVTSEQGYDDICYYGIYTLRFNKESYTKNFCNTPPDNSVYTPDCGFLGNNNTFHGQTIMEFLSENNYTCPLYLCMSPPYTYYISNTKMKNMTCIIGSSYFTDRKYSCGGINLYYNELQKANEEQLPTKNIITNLKKFCSSVVSQFNYNDPNKCVKECLIVSKDINEMFGIDFNAGDTCGFSGRLVLFIGKVIKWIKYLVPVIVIVLSIIDFMKATGADKEDEIKKAQNKFIRRLIIAALIFLLPFVIEFVLNKMGFDANGCGIIDL